MTFTSSYIKQCPDCSNVLSFASEQTQLIICSSCGSVVRRKEDGTLQTIPQFTIINKATIIQPGTTGKWENKSYVVLGRFRAWFEEAVFNYWTIQFENNELALLGEGYGHYAILKTVATPHSLSSKKLDGMKTGEITELTPANDFILEKKQTCFKWEVEGELYIPGTSSSFRVYDFSHPSGRKLALFDFGKDTILAFEARHSSFAVFDFKNLRDYDNKGRDFLCTNCSQRIIVKTFPYAQSCACTSCGLSYSLKDELDFKKEKGNVTEELVYLPISSKGLIHDIEYEVIGYVQKEELSIYHSKWREYTLFNPREGFAFLSEYDGHWIYLRERGDAPVLYYKDEGYFYLGDTQFNLFNSYTHKVINARGEFPYNIFDNQQTKAREFIAPPEIWIQERDNKEGIKWFWGSHITSEEVAAAFGVTDMPYRTGIGAIQPTGYISWPRLAGAALLGFFLLLLVHTFIDMGKQNRLLFDNRYAFPDSTNQVSFVTEKFVFDKWRSNLQLKIEAPVSNSWFELGATLVNAETGKEYTIEKGVEYYFGYSGGESWTEGSTQENAYFTRIPAGTYFLQLQGTRDNTGYGVNYFYVEANYDVNIDRNLWISIVLLLLWPAGKYLVSNYNEKRRWSNSPYSPFTEDE